MRVLRDGQPDHVEAVLRIAHLPLELVRRLPGGDEHHPAQAQTGTHLLSDDQVADVDRIVGAPEQSYVHRPFSPRLGTQRSSRRHGGHGDPVLL